MNRNTLVVLEEISPDCLPRLHQTYNDCFSIAGRGQREDYDYWRHLFTHPKVRARSVVVETELVGAVALFQKRGDWEVTYWVTDNHRRRGIATYALREFLSLEPVRPVLARVREGNFGSCRVLEKCGFDRLKEEWTYCDYREEDYLELVYVLNGAEVC